MQWSYGTNIFERCREENVIVRNVMEKFHYVLFTSFIKKTVGNTSQLSN